MIYLNGKKVEFIEFPNKERRLDLKESDLNHVPKNVPFQAFHIYNNANTVYWKYENDASIFELFLLDDAIESLDQVYNLYIGYMPYSRMDRVKEKGTAFSLKILTDLMKNNLKALNLLFILDPHSKETLNQFPKEYQTEYANYKNHAHEFKNKKHLDEKNNKYEFAKDVINYTKVNLENAWFVFPDKGAAKRYNADDYPNVIICEKVRDFATGKIQQIKAHIEKQTTKPNKNAPIIIIDDLCSYGGTFVGAIHVYKKLDHMNVTPYDTHISPQDCYNTYTTSFSETEVLILTNNEEKEYLFIDKVNNLRLYMLPIDYQKEKSLKIYNNVHEIKNQINKIIDKIKPIDAEKLHDLIIEHYKNL